MKRFVAFAAAVCCTFCVNVDAAYAENIEISAKSAVVISADTGEIV